MTFEHFSFRKLSVMLFGGCFEIANVSTNDTWYEWRQKRDGWLATKIDRLMNHGV